LAIVNLKSHKSPGIDQISAELIKAGDRTIRCEIHKLIISIWNKEELPEEWKESTSSYSASWARPGAIPPGLKIKKWGAEEHPHFWAHLGSLAHF
jgi:hypothetical protein